MSKQFEDLLTAYMVVRDYVEAEHRKYKLLDEKPELDIAIEERREARRKLLAYVAELEAKAGVTSPEPKIAKPQSEPKKTKSPVDWSKVPEVMSPDEIKLFRQNLDME